MIDLHSHILPGIDDGAPDLSASLAMAEQSLAAGVTHMVCTPHIHQGYFDNDLHSIEQAFSTLVAHLRQAGCVLHLAYAAEVRITPEVIPWVEHNRLPYLGTWQEKRCLLLELPHSHIPPGTDNLLRWLHKNNVQPIIAHPERNRDVISDYRCIAMLKRNGCLLQVTAGAFTGRFSEPVKQMALRLLNDGLIDYVASDTHSIKRRPNEMGEARALVAELSNSHTAEQLFYAIPRQLTEHLSWH